MVEIEEVEDDLPSLEQDTTQEGTLKFVGLTIDHADRVIQFCKDNAFTEPIANVFQGDKPLEGSSMLQSLEYLVTVCLMPDALEDADPSSCALVNGDKIIAVSLGTKETFPKVWGMKECSAFRGQDASGMFGLSTDMERIAGEKMKGKLNGKTVQITRLFCVATKMRRKGIGAFFLSQVLNCAKYEECHALYFLATGENSQKMVEKLKIKSFNYIKYESYASEFPKFKEMEDAEESCKGYLVLFDVAAIEKTE